MRELQAIHSDRDNARERIANAGVGVDTSQWQVEEMRFTDELKDATVYWDAIQAHTDRVQDATSEITTRLDTLYLGGQTLRELCADEEAYQILRISFTQDYISQATKNSEVLTQVQAETQAAIKQANDRANVLDDQNTILLQEKHKLTIDLADITSKFQAATDQLAEAPSNEETEKLKQTIADLTAQLELKAKAEQPKGDAKSQIDAMVQERENKKPKITNLRLADPSGINTKDYLATDVLTGEQISIHSNYVRSYKEVSAVEAEQIRADEANRLAEEARQNEIIPTVEPVIEPLNNVLEEEVPTQEVTFQEEVQGTHTEADTESVGNQPMEQVVGATEESQVKTIDQQITTLYENHRALRADFENLKVEVRSISSNLSMNGAA